MSALAARRALDALRRLRAIIERGLDGPFNPEISVMLDLLTIWEDAMNDALDRALTPTAFDYASCSVCGGPTPVPLSWVIERAAVAIHERCHQEIAAVVVDEAA